MQLATIVLVALELPLAPAKDAVVAGCVPPEKAADRMADVVDVEERAVLLIRRHSEGNEPVVGKLLSPKFPKLLLEGMVPSRPSCGSCMLEGPRIEYCWQISRTNTAPSARELGLHESPCQGGLVCIADTQ